MKERIAERVSVSALAHAEEERRRQERFECEGFAEVSTAHGGLSKKGCISDVSLTGCFVEAPTLNLERGTQVEVYFETRQLRFRIAGNILAVQKGRGVGIAFLHPSARTVRMLQELIEELERGRVDKAADEPAALI